MTWIIVGAIFIAVGLLILSSLEMFDGWKTYILGGIGIISGALEQSGLIREALPPEYAGIAIAGLGFLILLVSKLTKRG